jgi:hypothetical protein
MRIKYLRRKKESPRYPEYDISKPPPEPLIVGPYGQIRQPFVVPEVPVAIDELAGGAELYMPFMAAMGPTSPGGVGQIVEFGLLNPSGSPFALRLSHIAAWSRTTTRLVFLLPPDGTGAGSLANVAAVSRRAPSKNCICKVGKVNANLTLPVNSLTLFDNDIEGQTPFEKDYDFTIMPSFAFEIAFLGPDVGTSGVNDLYKAEFYWSEIEAKYVKP